MSELASPEAGGACDACLRRTWLVARLASHLDRQRDRLEELLCLGEPELIAALAGRRAPEIERGRQEFDPDRARATAQRAELELVCRCRAAYPAALLDLAAPPGVLHVAGDLNRLHRLLAEPAVAIVGAREPSAYGLEVATALARGAAATGLTVLSGMARGIDAAAHRGALQAGGATVAVLPGAAELPYPARTRALHARIRHEGAVVSELPPGTRPWRWTFPARNRLIAALGAMTVVVEARVQSGALITAGCADRLGRWVGAVPGRITSPLARGPHDLLRQGASLIESVADILEVLYGPRGAPRGLPAPPELDPEQRAVLDALATGADVETATRRAGLGADRGLAVLAGLELSGRLTRGQGGRYCVRL